MDLFEEWQKRNYSRLMGLKIGDHPKELIDILSEDLLKTFSEIHLIDTYDVYQYLMDYWTSTMMDDVSMIVTDGWVSNPELIPAELIINRYFKSEQGAIEKLENEIDIITAQKEEMEEEQSGEEGVLEELKSEKGSISKGEVQKRIKEIESNQEYAEELAILYNYYGLIEQETGANKKIKEAQKDLYEKVANKYKVISETEVKILIVEDKWLGILENEINGEVEKISHNFTDHVKDLAERYETSLPNLEQVLGILTEKVTAHLNKMGFEWR
jgi:type I restriction enzyme M protein